MTYVTTMRAPIKKEMTFEDLLFGDRPASSYYISNDTNTITRKYNAIPTKYYSGVNFSSMISRLTGFNKKYSSLFLEDMSSLYKTFYIPKKSGRGLRRIDAPQSELMGALKELKQIFERDFFALYHTSAFAYIKGRSTVSCIKRHQSNESKWFMKIDFSNFFGSTTLEFVYNSLCQIYPFNEVVKSERGAEALRKSLSLCFLNGGLPQGTPISPLITNLMMIPVDFALANKFRNFNKNALLYTRYADDLIISSKYGFNKDAVQECVADTLKAFGAPFKINEEKTRYGSSSGSNWNLGVILNKDNDISVGRDNKKHLKGMINNFLLDTQNDENWELGDLQALHGVYAYYSMVEKENIEHIVREFNKKYKVNFLATLKKEMKKHYGQN